MPDSKQTEVIHKSGHLDVQPGQRVMAALSFLHMLTLMTGCGGPSGPVSVIKSEPQVPAAGEPQVPAVEVPVAEEQLNAETAALLSETELQAMTPENLASYYAVLLVSAHPDEAYMQLVEKILAQRLVEVSSVPAVDGSTAPAVELDQTATTLATFRRQLEVDLKVMETAGHFIHAASVAANDLPVAQVLYHEYRRQIGDNESSTGEVKLTLEQLKAVAARDYLLQMLAAELKQNPALENDPSFAEVLAYSRTDLSLANEVSWANYYCLLDSYLQNMVLPVLRLVYPNSMYPDYFERDNPDRYQFIQDYLVEGWARVMVDKKSSGLFDKFMRNYRTQDSAKIVIRDFLSKYARENNLPYPTEVEAYLFEIIEEILPKSIELAGTSSVKFSFEPQGTSQITPPKYLAEITLPLINGLVTASWNNEADPGHDNQPLYVFTGNSSEPLLRVFGFPMAALDAENYPNGFIVYWYEGDEPVDGSGKSSRIIIVPAQFLLQSGGDEYSYGSKDERMVNSLIATTMGVDPAKLHRMLVEEVVIDGDRGAKETGFQRNQGYVLIKGTATEWGVLVPNMNQPDDQHYPIWDSGVREPKIPPDKRDGAAIVNALLALYLGNFDLPPGLIAALMRASETTATQVVVVPRLGTPARIFCKITKRGSLGLPKLVQPPQEVGWTSAPMFTDPENVSSKNAIPMLVITREDGSEEEVPVLEIIEQEMADGTIITYYVDINAVSVYPTELKLKDLRADCILTLLYLLAHDPISKGPAGGPLLLLFNYLLRSIVDSTYRI